MTLRSALLGLLPPSPPRAAVEAAAATVALARPSSSRATVPWGFGPPLAPAEWPLDAPPWWDRGAAITVPAVARGRDLICSAISQLPLTLWTTDAQAVPIVERRVPAPTWFARPDPDRTRQWLLAWTVDDLIFYGAAHWQITARYADTYPAAFRRLPPGSLAESSGSWTITDPDGRRTAVPARDLVEFLSPVDALLDKGYRAISIALQLDTAADRFASCEVPAGILEEIDGGQEDLSAEELAALASAFSAARHANTTAATNRYLKYREIAYDASKAQVVEGRTYQALEMARITNIPPYLIGAPAGTGMTYLNGQQARQDLVDFGAQSYIGCIEQTLSGPNVTPRGQTVRLDLNAWLRNPFTTDAEASPTDEQVADPTQLPAPAPMEVVE